MCENSEDLPPQEFLESCSSAAQLPLPSIALFRQAAAQHSMAETRFGLVDVQTANLVVTCYDKGNEKTKQIIESGIQRSPAHANIIYQRCWSLVK